MRPDNIVYDIGNNGQSAGGFGHPKCINASDPKTLPAVAIHHMYDLILDFLKARLSTEQLTWLTQTPGAMIVDTFEIIYAGGAGAMQAFGNRLTQEEILKIMAFLDSIKKR